MVDSTWKGDKLKNYLNEIPAMYLPAYGFNLCCKEVYGVDDLFEMMIDEYIDETGAHITVDDSYVKKDSIECVYDFEGIIKDCPIEQKDVDDFIETDISFSGEFCKEYRYENMTLAELAEKIASDLTIEINTTIDNAIEDAQDEAHRYERGEW